MASQSIGETMIHTKRAFDHVGMAVPDLDQAVDFFVDVFGFDVVITAGPYDGLRVHLAR